MQLKGLRATVGHRILAVRTRVSKLDAMQDSRLFWAKLNRDGERHPLIDHCADVAAVCEALLQHTLLRQRLAHLGGLDDLNAVQIARLSVLAALHDAGKFNHGFQNRSRGHQKEILNILKGMPRFHDAIDLAEIASWMPPKALLAMLVATFCHHGKPLERQSTPGHPFWKPENGIDPLQGIADLVRQTRAWFPEAWQSQDTADMLPDGSEFQHAWNGLLTLADWLGSNPAPGFFPFSNSNEDRMPFARQAAKNVVQKLALDASTARHILGKEPFGYERLAQDFVDRFEPRPAQQRILNLPLPSDGSVTVLEAATGAGKTEAAMMHFLRLYQAGLVDGLYFALPTRAAATQIFERVRSVVAHAFPENAPPVVQAVPGYIVVDGIEGVPLPHFEVLWPDQKERMRYRGWAAEHPKRYLAGAIVVGTIDQVLASTLTVSHAQMRATALLRQLLVVDEVHASDTYMTSLLEGVLDQHLQAGGHAFLMSATLGSAARERLLANPGQREQASPPEPENAIQRPYPQLTTRSRHLSSNAPELAVAPIEGEPVNKNVTLEFGHWAGNPRWIAETAYAAVEEGARVLIIRNLVDDCLAVQQELERIVSEKRHPNPLFGLEVDGHHVATPHHSRYARDDRQLLDQAIENLFGKGSRERHPGGVVAVTTQTVEQSLDIDADLLLTDLCPIDVLLQRIGRLHRHTPPRPAGYEKARAIILGPAEPLGSMIRAEKDGKGLGPHGLGPVYEDLRVLELTRRLILKHRETNIPADNRRLVEEGTHPALLEKLVSQLGGPWQQHQGYVHGMTSFRYRHADVCMIQRHKRFDQHPEFPSKDERHITTRLGLDDRLIRFSSPHPQGPFGSIITNVSIPGHWLGDIGDEDNSEVATEPQGESAFVFVFGKRRYRYDRWGLRPLINE